MTTPAMLEDVETAAQQVSEPGTLAVLSSAEIDRQIATAHQYPRNLKRFRDKALEMITLNEAIARECIYALPRDGKVIEGPSARFAEILISAWGNCRAGARIVAEGAEFVTAQGVFFDLETNVAVTQEVQRRITDKRGRRFSPDMIGVTANACSAIALRNAVLKGIPKAFWAEHEERARKTIMGDFQTLANRRANAFTEFQRFGVQPQQIYDLLEVKGKEDIGLEQLVTLSGMLTALKAGDTTIDQLFPQSESKSPGIERVKEQLRRRRQEDRESLESPAERLFAAIASADTKETLDDVMAAQAAELQGEELARAQEAYNKRQAELDLFQAAAGEAKQ